MSIEGDVVLTTQSLSKLFSKIDNLIHQVYPGEKVTPKKWCLEWNLGLSRIGFVPFGTNFSLLPKFEKLSETDKGYYIDKRLSLVGTSLLVFIIFLIVHFFANSWFTSIMPQGTPLEIYFWFFVVLLFGLPLVGLFFQMDIEVIRKSWVNGKQNKGNLLILEGVIPPNSITILTNDPEFKETAISTNFIRTFFLV